MFGGVDISFKRFGASPMSSTLPSLTKTASPLALLTQGLAHPYQLIPQGYREVLLPHQLPVLLINPRFNLQRLRHLRGVVLSSWCHQRRLLRLPGLRVLPSLLALFGLSQRPESFVCDRVMVLATLQMHDCLARHKLSTSGLTSFYCSHA
eukprot:Gregarina_sp_Pseudo_9__1318@NODE_1881_length_1277_cov_8_421648_g1745_i0_p1_GENE_NODE_1881_length_1277_cov_8_421648_g1745_i0NODE_1881_length_1277_cov_8_421648_g1745_i0_p1_ORF_typecomplete_len150_score4_13DUF4643/PF15485_6/0_015_NODE_1881_length_1277_cov_8_421648_g1745_i0393842